LAIRLLLVPVGVGVGIGIGIDSDCVLWLVPTHCVTSLPEFRQHRHDVTSKAYGLCSLPAKAPHRLAGHPGWRRTPTRNRVQSRNSAVDLRPIPIPIPTPIIISTAIGSRLPCIEGISKIQWRAVPTVVPQPYSRCAVPGHCTPCLSVDVPQRAHYHLSAWVNSETSRRPGAEPILAG
jgi:hypothetical protein